MVGLVECGVLTCLANAGDFELAQTQQVTEAGLWATHSAEHAVIGRHRFLSFEPQLVEQMIQLRIFSCWC